MKIMRRTRQSSVSVLSTLIILAMTLMSCSVAELPSVPEYFPEVKDDLSAVIWSHATNSIEKLQEAFNDSTMMIEADILMGTKEGSNVEVPIMAHPPATTSDLTAVEFITNVIHATTVDKKRKGIKLDFKQYEALLPVLQHLKMVEDEINFPIWLNADILQGPVNSTRTPIPAREFINECQNYFKDATLSLGWTTRFGHDSFVDSIESKPKTISEGQYTSEQINEMLDLLDDVDSPVTFPVRAGIAAQSIDVLNSLVGLRPDSTLTLWSPDNDPIDMSNLTRLINEIGKHKTYIDLPFDLKTGPKILTDKRYDSLYHQDGTNSSVSSILVSFSTLIMTLTLLCTTTLLCL